ncbi:hypothetical protein TNCV_414601 [Trichonephila clavipes]|nr:hypothetical protein TNCV_414601 [Trichonephila clavipes]
MGRKLEHPVEKLLVVAAIAESSDIWSAAEEKRTGDDKKVIEIEESAHCILNRLWHPDVDIDHFANSILHTVVYGQIDSYGEGLRRNVGASRFNEPDGRKGCVLTRTVESNQGGRFDSNESVADSFPSGAVGFKSWSATILGGFFPLTSARKNLQSGSELAARGHPSVAPLLSDKYHPCKF